MTGLASRGQLRASFLRWALLIVPAVSLLGFLSGRLAQSGPGNAWFDMLVKPSLFPPPATFGIVWSILYVMMGLALTMLVTARGAQGRGAALAAFAVQFALNLCWSPLFFGMHMITAALFLILGMFVSAVATTIAFGQVRTTAAWLMVPYLAWLCFAAVLNWETIRLNPGAEGLVVERSGTQIDIRR